MIFSTITVLPSLFFHGLQIHYKLLTQYDHFYFSLYLYIVLVYNIGVFPAVQLKFSLNFVIGYVGKIIDVLRLIINII